jgi:hypothetical protein
MCQSPPFTYTCNSARSPATGVRTVLCARPRWMYASCQWQRLSKAAVEGRLETSYAWKRQKTFTCTVCLCGSDSYGSTSIRKQKTVSIRKQKTVSIRIDVITGYRVVMVWPLRAARRSTVAVRSSHRDTALAPPSVPARLIRCAGHC